MVLDYKESFDSTLSAINDELKNLSAKFCKLETDQAISGNVNEKLTQQLSRKKYWANEQYPCRECLEI